MKLYKNLLSIITILILSHSAFAQKDITQFLEIPIDGSKTEMIRKLKAKGFSHYPENNNMLLGEFNGKDVIVNVATNNNKVYRIIVADVYSIDEASIKIRFNNLCRQFMNNAKYTTLYNDDQYIPEDEVISNEMIFNNKLYEAVFYQKPEIDVNSEQFHNEVIAYLSTIFTEEELRNYDEKVKKESEKYISDKLTSKTVWFTIQKDSNKYFIVMFYDNVYNKADGSDL